MAKTLTAEQIVALKEKKLITSTDFLEGGTVDDLKAALYITEVIPSADIEDAVDSTDSTDSSDDIEDVVDSTDSTDNADPEKHPTQNDDLSNHSSMPLNP